MVGVQADCPICKEPDGTPVMVAYGVWQKEVDEILQRHMKAKHSVTRAFVKAKSKKKTSAKKKK